MAEPEAPTWLRSLVEVQDFFTNCIAHNGNQRIGDLSPLNPVLTVKTTFCIECSRSLCTYCRSDDNQIHRPNHHLLEFFEHGEHYAVKEADIAAAQVDYSFTDIQTSCENDPVLYISTAPVIHGANNPNCVTCNRKIRGENVQFCTILCKVNR